MTVTSLPQYGLTLDDVILIERLYRQTRRSIGAYIAQPHTRLHVRVCPCGVEFTRTDPRARFCSTRCNWRTAKQAQRQRDAA